MSEAGTEAERTGPVTSHRGSVERVAGNHSSPTPQGQDIPLLTAPLHFLEKVFFVFQYRRGSTEHLEGKCHHHELEWGQQPPHPTIRASPPPASRLPQ